MSPAPAPIFTEIIGPPQTGRTFTHGARAGLGDCAPSGRMRLDAIARWLQDVAYADVEDAGLVQAAVWVVRRARVRVERFPRFGEHHTLTTYCSGMGRMWAERRTSIVRDDTGTPDVESVSLWVHLDPVTRRPAPFTDAEFAAYGDAAAGRRVSARLRQSAPPQDPGHSSRWVFRATELDLADHVNNAAYWHPLEEQLLNGPDPERLDAEMEYRTPAQPGEKIVLRDGDRTWIVDHAGEVHASVISRQI